MLALTQSDICHRHRHHGGMSKNTATDRAANSCNRNNTTMPYTLSHKYIDRELDKWKLGISNYRPHASV